MNISKAGKLGGLLLSMAVLPVSAAEWSIEPRVKMQAFVDDNFRLFTATPESESNITVSPSVIFKRKTEVSEIALDTRFDFRMFPGNSSLDSDDIAIRFNSLFKKETSQWSLGASIVRDSTITSELEDSGRLDKRRRREVLNVSPGWSMSIGERSTLEVSWSYSDARYDAPVTEFQDYTYGSLVATWQYQLNERNLLQVSLSKSNYEVDVLSFESKTTGMQVGVIRSITPLDTLTILLGGRSTDQGSGTESGSLIYLAYEHKTEKDKYSISASRDVQPSSLGQLNESDRIRLSWSKPVDELTYFTMSFVYGSNKNAGAGTTANNRDYATLNLSYSKRLGRNWRLGAIYSYREQTFDSVGVKARSNRIGLSAEYIFNKKAVAK